MPEVPESLLLIAGNGARTGNRTAKKQLYLVETAKPAAAAAAALSQTARRPVPAADSSESQNAANTNRAATASIAAIIKAGGAPQVATAE